MKAIEVSGDKRVAHALNAKGAAALRLKPEMNKTADYAERQIRDVARDSGNLQRSIVGGSDQYRDVVDYGFKLGTKVPYSRFVFRGTKYQDAQPPSINDKAIARHSSREILRKLRGAR